MPGVFDVRYNAGCEAACKTLADRWVLEMRIKASSVAARMADGAIWRVNIARSRRPDGGEGSSWAPDGAFHQPAGFRPVVFGSAPALVQNGGFEKTAEVRGLPVRGWTAGNAPPVFPTGWSLHEHYTGRLTILEKDVHSGQHACKVENGGWITSYFDAATGGTLHIGFWAKGGGSIDLMLFQYSPSPTGQSVFASTETIASVPLTADWKRYSSDHKVQRDKITRVGLTFGTSGATTLDDVWTVRESKQPVRVE